MEDENLKKLLDEPETAQLEKPPIPQILTINESQTVKSSRKQFLVVKSKDIKSSSKNSLTPDWDFGDSNSEYRFTDEDKTPTPHNFDKTFRSYYEDDDVFGEEMLKEFPPNYRDTEGQDTITSLTNNVFKKQLEKIRRKASLKSSNSSISTGLTENKKDSESLPNSGVSSLNSIFKSQESLISKKSSRLFDSISNLVFDRISPSLKSPTNLQPVLNPQSSHASAQNLNKIKRTTPEPHKASNEKIKESANTSLSKSDQVFDVIENVISNNEEIDKELVDKFISTFRILEKNHQRKKDKAKRACLLAELIVFLIVIVMTIFLAQTVFYQIQVIKNKGNPNSSISRPSQYLHNLTYLLSSNSTNTSKPFS